MIVEKVGQTVIEGVIKLVKIVRYDSGKRVERIYNGKGELEEANPLPSCMDFDRFSKHLREQ